jgi:hypothetical protein
MTTKTEMFEPFREETEQKFYEALKDGKLKLPFSIYSLSNMWDLDKEGEIILLEEPREIFASVYYQKSGVYTTRLHGYGKHLEYNLNLRIRFLNSEGVMEKKIFLGDTYAFDMSPGFFRKLERAVGRDENHCFHEFAVGEASPLEYVFGDDTLNGEFKFGIVKHGISYGEYKIINGNGVA